jgi:ABC-2 type transport system permease protein
VSAAAAAIAAREWRDLLRDTRFRVLVGLVAALLLAALAFGAARSERLEHEQSHASETDRRIWNAQGSKNPHAAAHFGQYAFKPAGPLALADPGIDPYTGSAVWLEAHRQNELQFRAARDAGLTARFADLSLALVLQLVLPLLAILVGFAAFAGERERGTLRQVLSLGCRPRDLLAGKALALGGLLAALLLPAALGVALLALGHAQPVQQLLRLCGLLLGYALYLGGFALLALAVSALCRSSRAALVVLLAFWLLNGFIAPRVATDLARTAQPLPSAQEFRRAIAEDRRKSFGHDPRHPAFVAFRDEVLRSYGVARLEDLPVNFRGLSLRRDDENGYAIFERHFAALQARFERQDSLRAAAGPLLPLLAIQPVSMALAGTDNRHQYHFAVAAEAHRRAIQTLASDDLIRNGRYGDASYQADPQLWAKMPAFAYSVPPAAWALASQWRNLLSLGVWFGLAALFAAVAVRRMRPL